MNRLIFATAFGAGAIAIIWIGRLFLGADTLGLAVTLLIGAVYVLGAFELLFFRRATQSLQGTLSQLSESVGDLNSWLSHIDHSLRHSVQARIEGKQVGLPAPVITPYLVGLLLMLGLLGTFIGMVDTLKGAVVALEGDSELEAVRQGLAAPIEGLGLAFGTSVAGVAASAMLGLLSTISRRDRIRASQLLDEKARTHMSEFSATQQQVNAYTAIQQQASALPEVAEQLGALTQSLAALGERIGQNLLESQSAFQNQLNDKFGELTDAVDKSLRATLVQSAEQINASIQPLAQTTLEKITAIAEQTHQTLIDQSQSQLEVVTEASQTNVAQISESVESLSATQSQLSSDVVKQLGDSVLSMTTQLNQQSQTVSESMRQASEVWLAQQTESTALMAKNLREEFAALREQESAHLSETVATVGELQSTVATHLGTLGAALEEPMTRLIETASETPKAAAEVIEKLRTEISNTLERDNQLVAERTLLMEQFDAMSRDLQSNSNDQRQAVESMIERSSETLSLLSKQFGEQVRDETGKMSDVAEHFAASSAEMASLGDVFLAAVTSFNDSNQQLMSSLSNIEVSLEKSSSRSDEQLAYYVAQAREIIDHNLLSHQQIIAALKAQKPEQLLVEEVG